MRRRLLAALSGLLWVASGAQAGNVEGHVSLDIEGADLAQLGPFVVYLESRDGQAAPSPTARAEVRQRAVRFQPDFLVVPVGQRVAMPNDDTIFHNVFSFSSPNDFDLGTYPAGRSKSVTFEHAGLVRIYCSIHDSMSGTIYVTPTTWFDTASSSGHYRIRDVPAGRYRLRVWNERLPAAARNVDVPAEGVARADVALGPGKP